MLWDTSVNKFRVGDYFEGEKKKSVFGGACLQQCDVLLPRA